MRKRLMPSAPDAPHPEWIDLSSASVEITSEDSSYPIERALMGEDPEGWRAAAPGVQSIRLVFDEPHDLQHISLAFRETTTVRTQEFALRWSPHAEAPMHEIVRQQWNFSPNGATQETEDYDVQLTGARVLELTITPNISGGESVASLKRLRVA